MDTLKLASLTKQITNNTLLLTLALMLPLLLTGEVFARTRIAHELFPYQYIGTDFIPLTLQLNDLDYFVKTNGSIDCIFLGNSTTYNAINPLIFEQAYKTETDQDLSCFNLAIYEATMTSLNDILPLIIDQYHPTLIIIGIELSSINSST